MVSPTEACSKNGRTFEGDINKGILLISPSSVQPFCIIILRLHRLNGDPVVTVTSVSTAVFNTFPFLPQITYGMPPVCIVSPLLTVIPPNTALTFCHASSTGSRVYRSCCVTYPDGWILDPQVKTLCSGHEIISRSTLFRSRPTLGLFANHVLRLSIR
jgi:hypothetical protein